MLAAVQDLLDDADLLHILLIRVGVICIHDAGRIDQIAFGI